jgi:hypothetical protein
MAKKPKKFLVSLSYSDGEHEHDYRGVISAKNEKQAMDGAYDTAAGHFCFGDDNPAERVGIHSQPMEISEEDAATLLRLHVAISLDEPCDPIWTWRNCKKR